MSDDMVEKVGRAIKDAYEREFDAPSYDALREDVARDLARAAIAAMRELDDAMVKAGIAADDKRTGNQTIRHIHRAMIDAALGEKCKTCGLGLSLNPDARLGTADSDVNVFAPPYCADCGRNKWGVESVTTRT